jgi:hypothetical protein
MPVAQLYKNPELHKECCEGRVYLNTAPSDPRMFAALEMLRISTADTDIYIVFPALF